MPYRNLNPLLKKGIDNTGQAPQLTADPSNPEPEDIWIVKTGGSTEGTPIGLLLALTREISGGGSATYELRFRTKENTTVGVALS